MRLGNTLLEDVTLCEGRLRQICVNFAIEELAPFQFMSSNVN